MIDVHLQHYEHKCCAMLRRTIVTYPSTLLTFSCFIFVTFFHLFLFFFLAFQSASVVLTANSCSTIFGHVSVTLLFSVTYLKYVKCIRWSLAYMETHAVVLELVLH